jgi:hypothetical protein
MDRMAKKWCLAAALLLASLLSGCRPEEVIAPEEIRCRVKDRLEKAYRRYVEI